MYGYRGRIGLIVPSSNTTNEPEFRRWAPAGVSVHSARMTLEDVNAKELVEMGEEVGRAAELLDTANVDVIGFGCTTGSLVKGAGYDEEITSVIEKKAGVPGIATSTAIRSAFSSLDANSIAIATPYTENMNRKEVSFLEDNNYEVVDIRGLGIEPNLKIGEQEPSQSYRLGHSVGEADADVLFISCTNFRTCEIIPMLEADLGMPVISSNSATLWALLQELGIETQDIDLGQLFKKTHT